MPNRCTGCGKIHPDDAAYIINNGCECGSKFFFFVREEDLHALENEMEGMTEEQVKEIEGDVREILSDGDGMGTVILDLESIRAVGPGKYVIDITSLLSQKPIVIKTGPGKYKIDFSVLAGLHGKGIRDRKKSFTSGR
ncbi:MAG: hypothetical protein HY518_02955 [Candidatus Aenigmarchaeota archaeon]|nr:hypothetical protein [Candidatus Aenigmarchaeota archaeon]